MEENMTTTPEVETVETAEVETSPAETGENVAEPAEQPQQTREQNAHFAAQRRAQERQAHDDEMFRNIIGDTVNPDTGKAFTDANEFIAWRKGRETANRARQAGMQPQTLTEIENRIREEVKANDPEILHEREELAYHRKKAADAQIAADLKEIRKAYPDEKAKSIEDMPEEFVKLAAAGIDPLVAYAAVREVKSRKNPVPPSTGDIHTASAPEKEFYSRSDVEAMSSAERIKHYDNIRKSMAKW